MSRILLVEDERDVREKLIKLLELKGYKVIPVETEDAAGTTVREREPFDLAIVDMRLGTDREGGLKVMKEIRLKDPFTQMIVLTAYGTLENVYESMEFYIYKYIDKKMKDAEEVLIYEVAKALEYKRLAELGIKKELIPVPSLTKEKEKELLEILRARNYLAEDKSKEVLEEQKKRKEGVAKLLVKMGYVSEECINWALSKVLDIPYVHISPEMVDPEVAKGISVDFLRGHYLIPVLKTDNELTVAMADPTDIEAIKEIQEKNRGCKIKVCLGTAANIIETIDRMFGSYKEVR